MVLQGVLTELKGFDLPPSYWQERDRVLAWLESQVPPARVQHILGVEKTALELASCHQVNLLAAARAALMHDLAKYFKPKQLLEMAKMAGLTLDPVEEDNPHLLHAEVSAIVAQEQFGVSDDLVLAAIRNHTLGCPGMSPLSCVVFLADTLEPGRGNPPELQQLRQKSQHNLYGAVGQACSYSIQLILHSSVAIHPRTVLTRNWALKLAHPSVPVVL
jgi:predicted HD superfamily hydrolase involved in NAD metabolism